MTLRSSLQPTVTVLRAGETFNTTLRAGTQLLVHKGEVRVNEPPLWLAETIVPVRTVLAEGGGHRVAATGCVTLSAAADAEVHWWEPASQWEVASGWVLSRAEVFLLRLGFAHRG
jgi:hypothetical protein